MHLVGALRTTQKAKIKRFFSGSEFRREVSGNESSRFEIFGFERIVADQSARAYAELWQRKQLPPAVPPQRTHYPLAKTLERRVTSP